MIIHIVKEMIARIGKLKGKKVYFAAPLQQDRVSTHQLEDYIINLTSLSRSDVRACITALGEVLRNEMFAGHIVDFADLGSFKLSSVGKQMEKKEDVTAATLKRPRVQFFPKGELRAMALQVQRVIETFGTKKPKHPKTPLP